jgi:hypothetical protein
MLLKNISYNNLVVLDWMNMIVVKLGLHKERHKKRQECDILSQLYSTMLYALIVHNFLSFPKAPDPIKEKSWK